MGIVTQLDGLCLQTVLQFCYVPFAKDSDALSLVNQQFFAAYRALPGECVRTIMRDYAKSEDAPEALLDQSPETLEEFRNRVFLMYLATLSAELKLHTGAFADDVMPLYPGAEPNPDILVDFCPPTAEDRQQMEQLARRVRVHFQSAPFECEWIAFDAFSDKTQYSVHHKWVKVEVALPEGGLVLEYQDSFEHEDPNFGPFGLAMRLLQATPQDKLVAAALGLEEGTTVVSQAFKECHHFERFRYFLHTDFFLRLGAALSWEACTLSQVCNLVSVLLTQTHRRVFSALLFHAHGVMRMEQDCPETIDRLRENLKLVYPSKAVETDRAVALAAQARERLAACLLPVAARAAAVLQLRRQVQAAYDGMLAARAEPPPGLRPLYPYPPLPFMTTFNPAMNQHYLNTFHYGMPPYFTPPFYPAQVSRAAQGPAAAHPWPGPPAPAHGPPPRPALPRRPPPGPAAGAEGAAPAPTPPPPAHPQPKWGKGYAGRGKGKGRHWSGRLPGGRGKGAHPHPHTPGAEGPADKAAATEEDGEGVGPPKLASNAHWPTLGSVPPKQKQVVVAKAKPSPADSANATSNGEMALEDVLKQFAEAGDAPAAAEKREPAGPCAAAGAAKPGRKKWRPLHEVLGQP